MSDTQATSAFPKYSHRQKAPLCLLIYVLAVVFIALGFIVQDVPPIRWLFPSIGLLMFVLAASFHYLSVVDQGEELAIRFGPIPLLRKTVPYNEIKSVETGRTLLLDGWGIHMSIRGGWVWNIWGRDCVVIHLRNGVLRVGSDDVKNLTEFLRTKLES